MEPSPNTRTETPAFGLAIIIFAIIFVAILSHLPFPDDYKFINFVGIFFVCGFVVLIIFGMAVLVINAIYKVIIEVLVATVIFLNAVYVAFCWAYFVDIVRTFNLNSSEDLFIVVFILVLLLFIIDAILVVLLLPFARLANSSLLD